MIFSLQIKLDHMRGLFICLAMMCLCFAACREDDACPRGSCEEKCAFAPADLCYTAYPETGYYYNRETKSCVKFAKSPCDGDRPCFNTLRECQACSCE